MPSYEYVCDECRGRRELRHAMAEEPSVRCTCGQAMRKDVGAAFPHVSLLWHFGQGIGDRLVIQSTRRRGSKHGDPAHAADAHR